MLKRMLVILLLIVPTALPATTGLCAMMQPDRIQDADNSDEMSCCPSDAGHCPMTTDAQAEPALSAESAPPDDADNLNICGCSVNSQSAPPARAAERQTSTLKAAPDIVTAPAEPDYRPVTLSHRATFPRLPSASHHHSCLRI